MNIVFKGLTEQEDARLREHAKHVLNTDLKYAPLERSNFWEAINEATDEQLNKAHALLMNGEHVAAAAAMKLIAYEYWFEYVCAISREEIIDQLATEKHDREVELQAH